MSEQFTKGPWRYDDGHGIVFDANDDFVCDTMPTAMPLMTPTPH